MAIATFPKAEKVDPIYRLTEDGKGLGLFQRITNAEAMENPAAFRAKINVSEKVAWFVPIKAADYSGEPKTQGVG